MTVQATKKLVIRQPINPWLRVVITGVSLAVFFLGYEAMAYHAHRLNPATTTMPYLSQVAAGFIKIVTPDRYKQIWLVNDLEATGIRLIIGMFFSCIISIVCGMMMGCFEVVEAAIKPYPTTASMIPATSMMAVFFLLVGTNFPFYVCLITFGVAPVLTLSIYNMTRSDVPQELVDKAYTLGASTPEVIWEVVLPILAPRILDTIRLMFGPAMLVLIAGEYQLADVGFGYRMRMQMRSLDMAVIYCYAITLCVIGFAINEAMIRIRRWWCPWFAEV